MRGIAREFGKACKSTQRTEFLHNLQELDDSLGDRADEHLPLTPPFGVGNRFEAIRQHSHKNHGYKIIKEFDSVDIFEQSTPPTNHTIRNKKRRKRWWKIRETPKEMKEIKRAPERTREGVEERGGGERRQINEQPKKAIACCAGLDPLLSPLSLLLHSPILLSPVFPVASFPFSHHLDPVSLAHRYLTLFLATFLGHLPRILILTCPPFRCRATNMTRETKTHKHVEACYLPSCLVTATRREVEWRQREDKGDRR